ncbi:aspartate kinase [Natroniella sulfidigena]|uniref:aspartate kinase n=1 Tax=Natroniella sulfidigena TaxID=723921 RepID=UPI00200AA0C7|nr:aspartate kinase [Natroniella sulfidigena]MCK8816460.1 aspartate kinase [Natroniella sulfidigena]
MYKIVIQKFGGSSVATPKRREQVIDKVINCINQGYKPVVVVSAIGREGAPYATDTLINFAQEVYDTIDPRAKDLLMSCGEVISSVVITQALKARGYEAEPLTGAQAGIITDDNFGNTRIKEVKARKILDVLDKGKIPIIAGFQGISESGEITTLGRGGSDTTACALGAALHAEMVEIYTDVEGVMTADPRIVPNAKTLKHVTYNEACELAYQGARVIHPRAAEISKRERVPVIIRSTFSDAQGTVISNAFEQDEIEIKGDKIVTGITSRTNLDLLKIFPRAEQEDATALGCFRILADEGISVDFINVRPDLITFMINTEAVELASELLDEEGYQYELLQDFVKVSIVGAGMVGVPGVMARIVEALTDADVSIYQTTDSHTTISCLIKKKDEEKSLCALHDYFNLGD